MVATQCGDTTDASCYDRGIHDGLSGRVVDAKSDMAWRRPNSKCAPCNGDAARSGARESVSCALAWNERARAGVPGERNCKQPACASVVGDILCSSRCR